MSKHTPGPWYIHDLRGIRGPISISCVTPDHISVADIGPGMENTEAEVLANARLIAAAPELLAALEAVWESGYNDIDPRIDYLEVQIDRDDWAAVGAAIAKATLGPLFEAELAQIQLDQGG